MYVFEGGFLRKIIGYYSYLFVKAGAWSWAYLKRGLKGSIGLTSYICVKAGDLVLGIFEEGFKGISENGTVLHMPVHSLVHDHAEGAKVELVRGAGRDGRRHPLLCPRTVP